MPAPQPLLLCAHPAWHPKARRGPPGPEHSARGGRCGFSTSASAGRGAELLQGPPPLPLLCGVELPEAEGARESWGGGFSIIHLLIPSLSPINLESALTPACSPSALVLSTRTVPAALAARAESKTTFHSLCCRGPISAHIVFTAEAPPPLPAPSVGSPHSSQGNL